MEVYVGLLVVHMNAERFGNDTVGQEHGHTDHRLGHTD